MLMGKNLLESSETTNSMKGHYRKKMVLHTKEPLNMVKNTAMGFIL